MANTINTIRDLAAQIYGDTYAIEKEYDAVLDGSLAKKKHANSWRSMYRISSRGTVGKWMYMKDMIEVLTKVIEKRSKS